MKFMLGMNITITLALFTMYRHDTCVEPVMVVRGAVASILVDDLFSLGTEETIECLTIA